jgi:hypothetical protein
MLHALSNEKVRFLLVGAYALAAHGYPRATMGIDIWVMPSAKNADARKNLPYYVTCQLIRIIEKKVLSCLFVSYPTWNMQGSKEHTPLAISIYGMSRNKYILYPAYPDRASIRICISSGTGAVNDMTRCSTGWVKRRCQACSICLLADRSNASKGVLLIFFLPDFPKVYTVSPIIG